MIPIRVQQRFGWVDRDHAASGLNPHRTIVESNLYTYKARSFTPSGRPIGRSMQFVCDCVLVLHPLLERFISFITS